MPGCLARRGYLVRRGYSVRRGRADPNLKSLTFKVAPAKRTSVHAWCKGSIHAWLLGQAWLLG